MQFCLEIEPNYLNARYMMGEIASSKWKDSELAIEHFNIVIEK